MKGKIQPELGGTHWPASHPGCRLMSDFIWGGLARQRDEKIATSMRRNAVPLCGAARLYAVTSIVRSESPRRIVCEQLLQHLDDIILYNVHTRAQRPSVGFHRDEIFNLQSEKIKGNEWMHEANAFVQMYSVWLMAFWLSSMEVTNSPVNARLMASPKGSFVSCLFPTAWSTERHWPQRPDADRRLNRLDLLDACRNAHGLQGMGRTHESSEYSSWKVRKDATRFESSTPVPDVNDANWKGPSRAQKHWGQNCWDDNSHTHSHTLKVLQGRTSLPLWSFLSLVLHSYSSPSI